MASARRDRGQSEVIGTMLVALAVVLLMTVIGVTLVERFQPEEGPLVDVDASVNATHVTLLHAGGDRVRIESTRVALLGSSGVNTRFPLSAATFTETDGDPDWEVGEEATHAHDLNGGFVRVLVVHDRTGTTLLDERLAVPSPPP